MCNFDFKKKSINCCVASFLVFPDLSELPENRKVNDTALILSHLPEMTPEAGGAQKPQEGHLVEIKCNPSEKSSFVIWFRVLDTSGMEFIGSFTANGMVKSTYISSRFTYTKIDQHIISLKKFNSVFDSGTYSCASFKNNELHFGEVTRLTGGEFCHTYLYYHHMMDALHQ